MLMSDPLTWGAQRKSCAPGLRRGDRPAVRPLMEAAVKRADPVEAYSAAAALRRRYAVPLRHESRGERNLPRRGRFSLSNVETQEGQQHLFRCRMRFALLKQ